MILYVYEHNKELHPLQKVNTLKKKKKIPGKLFWPLLVYSQVKKPKIVVRVIESENHLG